jgi:hypothetical protein
MVSCLVVNDAVKVALIKWRVPNAVAKKPEAKAEPKPEAKAEPKSEAKFEPNPDAKAKIPSDLTPQLVKRVHKLYEELGREDVRAVQELEQAQQDMHKDEPQK